MAKVLFVNPVIRQEDKPRHVPLGLSQLVALALRDGHQVQVFDANAWRPSDAVIAGVLGADDWDVVATGGLITSYGHIKKLVSIARRVAPKALIVAGGGFITPIPLDIMRFLPQIDVGVIGEGLVTLPEILAHVDAGDRDWADMLGVVWRGADGELHLNPERPLVEDLDALPFPAWDMFPVETYFANSSILLSEESYLAKRRLDIAASYGCPFKCKFCFHLGLSGELTTCETADGGRDVELTRRRLVRMHSPEYVVELVKHAREKFGVDFVTFLDENFVNLGRLTKGRWFDDFAERWMAAGLQPACVASGHAHDGASCSGVHWGTTAHAAMVDADSLRRMHELGCTYLDFGLESFSDEILRSIGKGSTAELNAKAVKLSMDAGIRPVPNQIIGFPDESFDSIKRNVVAWRELGIQSVPFFATPYPGSEWYFTYKDRILEQYDGDLEAFLLDLGDATKITAVIAKAFNAVELLGLRELMVNRDLKRIEDYERLREDAAAAGC